MPQVFEYNAGSANVSIVDADGTSRVHEGPTVTLAEVDGRTATQVFGSLLTPGIGSPGFDFLLDGSWVLA